MADAGRDLVGYREVGLHLTDEELVEMIAELGAVVRRRMFLPADGRTRRLLTTIVLPAD